MSSDEIDAICLSASVDEIKSYIDRREELGLTVEEVFNLIKATKDVRYIDDIISNDNICDELNLDPKAAVKLIEGTDNAEYIKSVIEDKKKRETLGLNSFDIVRLIKAVGDTDYTKSIVDDKSKRDEICVYSSQVVDLITATKDINYIEECVYKWRELELNSYLMTLIKSTEDINFMKKCVEERKKLGLGWRFVRDIIIETNDIEYIKNIIRDKAKREELGSFCVRGIIESTEEIDYIKSCIEEREELGLDLKDTIELVEFVEYDKWIENFLQSIETTKVSKNSRLIKLPNNITIGIEIESEGENSEAIEEKLTNRIAKNWICKHDGTLIDGAEVVSPRLTGDMKQASASIKKVCNRLQGLRSNSIC